MVIASGDIFTPKDAAACLEQTGCDALMLARGVRGNPWLFHQIRHYLETGQEEEKPSQEEMVEMILRHARMLIECKGELMAMREMRKHVAWYTKGLQGSAKLREEINRVESYAELEELLERRLPD